MNVGAGSDRVYLDEITTADEVEGALVLYCDEQLLAIHLQKSYSGTQMALIRNGCNICYG